MTIAQLTPHMIDTIRAAATMAGDLDLVSDCETALNTSHHQIAAAAKRRILHTVNAARGR